MKNQKKNPVANLATKLLIAASFISFIFIANPAFADDPITPCDDQGNCPPLSNLGCVDCPPIDLVGTETPTIEINIGGNVDFNHIQFKSFALTSPCEVNGDFVMAEKGAAELQLDSEIPNSNGSLSLYGAQYRAGTDEQKYANHTFTQTGEQLEEVNISLGAGSAPDNEARFDFEHVDLASGHGIVSSNGMESGLTGKTCFNGTFQGLDPSVYNRQINQYGYVNQEDVADGASWQKGQFAIVVELDTNPPTP